VGSVGAASFANAVNGACIQFTEELMAKSGKQFFVKPTAAQLMISENISHYQARVKARPPTICQTAGVLPRTIVINMNSSCNSIIMERLPKQYNRENMFGVTICPGQI